ncbi:unnamed protein product, partial [Meganyctiphanes norvegica]
ASRCGDHYRPPISSGTIQSPGFSQVRSPSQFWLQGHYDNNQNCEWTIEAPEHAKILLEFRSFNTELGLNCNRDYLEVRAGLDAQAPLLKRYCGLFRNFPRLVSPANQLYFYFHTNSHGTAKGFDIDWSLEECGANFSSERGVVQSPGFPRYYEPNRVCVWTISTDGLGDPNSRIRLHFTIFSTANQNSYLEIRNGWNSSTPLIATFSGVNQTIPDLFSSGNFLYLKFHTDNNNKYPGFQAKWNTERCGGHYNHSFGSIQSMGFPNTYLKNLHCEWTISMPDTTRIKLHFTRFDTANINNYLEIRSGNESSSSVIEKLYGRDLMVPELISASNILHLIFVTDNYTTYTGFHLEWSTVCYEDFNSSSGVLQSPGFPEQYPQNINCEWTISSVLNTKIKLTFQIFDTADANNFLEIRNGFDSSSPMMERLWGQANGSQSFVPEVLFSTGNQIYLHFQTNDAPQGKGFEMMWNIETCLGNFTSMTGSLSSMGYPLIYPMNLQCEWSLRMYSYTRAKLHFKSFSTANQNNYLEIRNGSSTWSPVVKKLYGINQTIADIISPTNQLYLIFRTDESEPQQGFLLFWSTVLGDNYTSTTGKVHSPGYPDTYPNEITSEWTITSLTGHKIRLEFQHFDTEHWNDYLEIRSGSGIDSPPIQRYYGRNMDISNFISPSSQLHLLFRTDHSHAYSGFEINWSPVCDVHEFVCVDMSCIPANRICNNYADCDNGSDESNCTVEGSTTTSSTTTSKTTLSSTTTTTTTTPTTTTTTMAPANHQLLLSGCGVINCPQNSECQTLINGTWACACKHGYIGDNCQSTCQISGCTENANCVHILDKGFTCQCKAGFIGESCVENVTSVNIKNWQVIGSAVVGQAMVIVVLLTIITATVCCYVNRKIKRSPQHTALNGTMRTLLPMDNLVSSELLIHAQSIDSISICRDSNGSGTITTLTTENLEEELRNT